MSIIVCCEIKFMSLILEWIMSFERGTCLNFFWASTPHTISAFSSIQGFTSSAIVWGFFLSSQKCNMARFLQQWFLNRHITLFWQGNIKTKWFPHDLQTVEVMSSVCAPVPVVEMLLVSWRFEISICKYSAAKYALWSLSSICFHHTSETTTNVLVIPLAPFRHSTSDLDHTDTYEDVSIIVITLQHTTITTLVHYKLHAARHNTFTILYLPSLHLHNGKPAPHRTTTTVQVKK